MVSLPFLLSQTKIILGTSQIKGFRHLLKNTFPSIYWIFRASQNTNRWRIIDTMFAKSQPLNPGTEIRT